MDKIKTVKIKMPDGSVSEETYTISVDAKNVDMKNGKDLQDTIGNIDVDTDGSISEQLKNKIDVLYIEDSLTSTDTDKALSANQGKNLKNLIDALNIDNKKKAYFFNTVADMKATNLHNGDFVCTLGYYNINDGGAAEYKITNTYSQTDYQENLSNNLYATLIINDFIKPEQVGAYGDGIHDDTAAIQKAIDTKFDVFMDNLYSVTNELIIYTFTHITFSKKARITFSGTGACFHGVSCYYTKLDNVYVNSSNRTGIGILLEKARNCEIFSPHLVNFSTGIKIDGLEEWCAGNNIYNPFIYKFNIGLHLTANSGKQTNNTTVIGGYIIDQTRTITTQYEESVCVKNDASCDTNIFLGVACEDADIGFLNQSVVASTPMSLICCRSERMQSYHFRNTAACANIYTYGCSFSKDSTQFSSSATWNQNYDGKNISKAYIGGGNYTDKAMYYYDGGNNLRQLLNIQSEGIQIGPGNGNKQRVMIRGTNDSQIPSTYMIAGGADGLVFPVRSLKLKSSTPNSNKFFSITVDDSGTINATEYIRQD